MKVKSYIIAAAACLAFSSCSDQFLKDMKNYESTTPEAYNYYTGAIGRLADLYMLSLPYNGSSIPVWQSPSSGNGDEMDKSTEEFSGFGAFVNPQIELTSLSTTNGVPDFFQGNANKIRNSAWGRIRDINDVINGVENSTLTDAQKNEILGQAYFLRAWSYYMMFRWYGGVPIITKVENPLPGDGTPVQPPRRHTISSWVTLIQQPVCSRISHGTPPPTMAVPPLPPCSPSRAASWCSMQAPSSTARTT